MQRATAYFLGCAGIMLLSGCGGTRARLEPPEKPPAWVDKLPQHTGKLCALGYSGPTFYQTDCLKNAADNARGHLSQAISVKIRTITIDISDGTRGSYDMDVMVEGSESASDTVLNGSEVESQWLDRFGQRGPDNGCYSLVCIDPSKPIQSLVDKLEEKKIPPKTVEKVRQNAEAAFEELEKEEAKVRSAPPPKPAPPPEKPAPSAEPAPSPAPSAPSPDSPENPPSNT
ncbi:MAG: hypothetical protein GYA21_04960 [Myxococcales bacterium]|nr:hypothetical protein [Myxococcales bacterium]